MEINLTAVWSIGEFIPPSIFSDPAPGKRSCLEQGDLNRIWLLRKVLQPMNTESMEFLFEKIRYEK
jgi:hypothetical protein